jgi:hypothetical protein
VEKFSAASCTFTPMRAHIATAAWQISSSLT